MAEEIIQQEPQPKSKLKALHESLVRDQYDVPTDYNVFERNLQDPAKLQQLHQSLARDKYDVPTDYAVFERNLMPQAPVEKKNDGQPSAAGLPGGSAPSQAPEPTAQQLQGLQEFAKTVNTDMSKPLPGQALPPVEMAPNNLERERNPLKTLTQKGEEVLFYQIPASIAATGAAGLGATEDLVRAQGSSLRSAGALPTNYSEQAQREIEQINQKLGQAHDRAQKLIGEGKFTEQNLNTLTQAVGEATERVAFLQKFKPGYDQSEIRKWQKGLIKWAAGEQNLGAWKSRNLVNRMTDINDPLDAINWVAGTLAESGVQIPASIATFGGSAIGQEIGSVYLDQIMRIAQEKKISPQEVIDKDLDSPAAAITYGTTAGVLDFLGAKGAMSGISKEALTKSLRQRTLQLLKASGGAGLQEGSTELSQTILEQIGAGHKDLDLQELAEAAAKGFVGGGGLHAVGAAATPAQVPQATPSAIPVDTQNREGIAAETPTTTTNGQNDQGGQGRQEGLLTPEAEQQATETSAPVAQPSPIAETPVAEQPANAPTETAPVQPESTTSDSQNVPTDVQQPEAPAEAAGAPAEPAAAVPEGERNVEFQWLGDPRRGVVVGEKNGKLKIKSEGTIYSIPADKVKDVADKAKKVKKSPTAASVEKKMKELRHEMTKMPNDVWISAGGAKALTEKGADMFTKYSKLKAQHQKLLMKEHGGEQASTDKFYEPPLGMAKKSSVGRINVSPIYGGKPKLLKDIMLDLNKSTPGNIYYTKSPAKGRRALGAYNPGLGTTAIKFKNDLDVTAHETGHALDDRYGIVEAIPAAQKAGVEGELMKLSKYGSKPPKGHPAAQKYKLGEGMAEYLRAWMVNPQQAEFQFPETTQWIKQAVPAKVLQDITKFGSDIRSYSGLTGHHQVMSNVQFEPEKSPNKLVQFFKPVQTTEGFKITWVDRLHQKLINDKAMFEKATDFLADENGVKLNPAEDPRLLAKLFLGSNEKLDNIFEKGLVNSRNKYRVDRNTGKRMTFQWLIEPFDKTNAAKIKEEQQEAISYMIAERTKELAGRFNREDLLTGIGGGIFRDVDVANKRLQEFQAEPQDKQDRIQEAVRRYRAYADAVLKYMVAKGRLSPEQYQNIKADNIQYVALQRVLEAAPGEEIVVYANKKTGNSAVGSSKDVLKKIKGSTATIQNPYQSLVETTVKSIKEADRNEVMQSFRDLFTIARGMYQGEPGETGAIARPATAADKNTVPIFVDGKVEHWQLQPDVYKAVKNIMDTGKTLPWFMTALGKLLRTSVTTFPVFAVRNRIRDIQHRMVVSDTKAYRGYDIYKDKKTKQLTKDMYQLFGGGQAGYYLMNDDFYYKKMDEAVQELSKDKNTILAVPGKMLDGYMKMLNAGERATRLEEYRSAYKHATGELGMDKYNASIYAAYKARDLLDFAVAGEWMRVVNQVVPFSNAAVQGLTKTYRSAKEDPGGFALRFLIFAVIPSLLTRALVHAMDKDDEYENMPDYRRDLFYNIPLADDMWLTLPKPFEVGVLSSAADRGLGHMLGEQHAFDGYHWSVAKSVWPVDEAILLGSFKPFVETMANKDFFRDKRIIPVDEENLDLDLRNTGKASRLGKALQEVVGVDARYIDHVVKGTTSYYGDLALRVSDIGREDSRHPFNYSLTGLFKSDPLYDSKNIQKVQEIVRSRGIHWSDPFYQQLNELINTYYQTQDPVLKAAAGKEAREFAGEVLKAYENDENYKREDQVLEE